MFFKRKEKLNIDSLKIFFDNQRKILIEKDYPTMLDMSLEDFNNNLELLWKSLLEKVNNIEIKIKGKIPLLLVVKNNFEEKIKKINGHTDLYLDEIKNKTGESSSQFYFLLDVEDGSKMVAKSAKDALKKFTKEKRFALNLDESFALLTYYPEILKNHYLISAGSFYNKEGESLPLLWLLNEDYNPELHYAWFNIAHGSYGAGSYAIKI